MNLRSFKKKSIQKYVPRREDIARIKVLDRPEEHARGEGVYEWRYMSDKYLLDIIDVKVKLEEIAPGKSEHLLDRLQNMRVLYFNFKTNEISS